MISSIGRILVENLKNIPGYRSKRKIVIFESDDWGSLRLIDKGHRDQLLKVGVLQRADDPIGILDALEDPSDLSNLFEVLTSFRDANCNHPIFTPFFNMGNPDFDKIAEDNYEVYFSLDINETFKQYGESSIIGIYHEGINEKVFEPQLHGREHVNVLTWMKHVGTSESNAFRGFQHRFSAVSEPLLPKYLSSFRATYYMNSTQELDFNEYSLVDASLRFGSLFGYRPIVFDAPNAVFHRQLEKVLADIGIRNIVTPFYRLEPDLMGGIVRTGRYGFGQTNEFGQRYHIRNCMFEPYKGVNEYHTLRMLEACFRWGKPAVISTHRVNYVGGIDIRMRDNSLKLLRQLLDKIIGRWPDVEFMSSGQLCELMHGNR